MDVVDGKGQTSKGSDGASTQRPATKNAEMAKIRLTRKSAAYWEMTLPAPRYDRSAGVRELVKILGQIEADPKVKVIVFDNAEPDYFIAHYDLPRPLNDSTGMKPGHTGIHPMPDFMVRLSRLKQVTMVSIRGRASGIGSGL